MHTPIPLQLTDDTVCLIRSNDQGCDKQRITRSVVSGVHSPALPAGAHLAWYLALPEHHV